MNSLLGLLRDPKTRVPATLIFALTVLQSFLGPMDLAVYPYKMTVGVDNVVTFKLVLATAIALVAAWGIWQMEEVRATLTTIPAILISLLLLLTMIGATSGLSFAAMPTSAINYTNFVFVITAIAVLGLRGFSLGIVCGVMGTAVFGLYLFYFMPVQGVFTEPIAGGQFIIRLGGLAHPNSVARSVTIATLSLLFLHRTKESNFVMTALAVLFFGWTAILAKSRTAMVAGLVGACLLYGDKLKSRAGLTAITLAFVIGVAGLFTMFALGKEQRFMDKIIGMISKDNSAEELTTGTGRTEIWAEATKFIAVRPLLGYGLNSGPILLVDHSQATHNAIMNATLSGGIMAGLIMLALQLWGGWNALFNSNLAIRALSGFLFFSCLTEDTVFETFPGPCSMLWYACCIVPVMDSLVSTTANRQTHALSGEVSFCC